MSNPKQWARNGAGEREHPRGSREHPRGGFGTALGLAGVALLALGIAFTALGTPAASESPAVAKAPSATATGTVAASLDVQRIQLPTGPVYIMTLGLMTQDESALLKFASGQHYEFIVRQGGREVWRWSAGRAFHQGFNELRLEPGVLMTFVQVWDGTDTTGLPIHGEVEVEAWVNSTHPMNAQSVSLFVDEIDSAGDSTSGSPGN